MLESIPAREWGGVVRRYHVPRRDLAALRDTGIDPDGVREMLDLLSHDRSPGILAEMIAGSFQPWNSVGPPHGSPTRFSDGTWPVCYTALDDRTACEEIVYHRRRALFDRSETPRTAYYCLIELDYEGSTIDLRELLERWPDLVHLTDYSFCNQLGREAITRVIDAFLAPSARHQSGTSVPVFRLASLRSPRQLHFAAFTVDPVTGQVTVDSRPSGA